MDAFSVGRAVRHAVRIAGFGVSSNVRVVELTGATGYVESEPRQVWVYGVRYFSPGSGECVDFWPGDEFREPRESHYIVDGVGMHVGGWSSAGYVTLYPMGEDDVCVLPARVYALQSVVLKGADGIGA